MYNVGWSACELKCVSFYWVSHGRDMAFLTDLARNSVNLPPVSIPSGKASSAFLVYAEAKGLAAGPTEDKHYFSHTFSEYLFSIYLLDKKHHSSLADIEMDKREYSFQASFDIWEGLNKLLFSLREANEMK